MKQTERILSVLLVLVMMVVAVPVMEVGAADINLIWPCKSGWYVTTLYYYSTGTHATRWGYQYAIDISGGGDILAAAAGTVETSEFSSSSGFGNCIVIKHSNGAKTLYGHLSSRAVSVGQTVTQGQVIGVMGSTGNSSGTHLHFEYSEKDPWRNYFWDKYAENIIYGSNVRVGNVKYNSDQFVVNVIDKYYTLKDGWYYKNSTPITTTPGTPTLTVSSENVSNKNVTFTWNKVSNVDHYDLRVYNYGVYNVGAPYGEWGIAGSRTSSSIKLPKGKYAAYITAVSSSGGEAPSVWISPLIVSDPPGTPVLTINNIFVTDNIDNGGVEFKWTKAANTDHYDLRVYNHGDYNTGAPYTAFNLPASQTSTKMKLPIGKYAAYITAVAESGAGAPSEWITVFNVFESDVDANFPTNIKTYKMWTGDTSTYGYDCSNYSQAYLTDNELKIVKVYNNNWVKAEATVSGATKSVYIPLGGIIGTSCTIGTKYCKASTPVYRRYNNTTVYHTLAKDTAVKVIGTYQDTRIQICYTVSGQSYIGWVLNDTLAVHSSTGHSYTSTVTKAATCTADGVRTYTCACGASYTQAITKLGHSYGAWTKLNDTQHQRVCSRDSSHVEKANHSWNTGTVTKTATCTATGVKTYTCTVCKATKTETISATGHSYGAWTKLNDTQHQRVCSRDSSHVEKANHSWNSGTVTKAATCSATGTKTYTCTVCNATKTENIAALGHSYGTWTKLNDTQHQRVCSRDSSHVEKANHTWNSGTVTKAATCAATGTKTYTCTVCNATKTEKNIAALGHSYGTWTKLNDTQHQRVCSRDSSHVEKANHSWNSGTVTKAATCAATGTKTYTCTVCNATKTETIPVNTGNHVNTKSVAATASTCTVKGYTAGVYCNDCKKYISGHAEQPLAAHQTTTQNAKTATCTAEGYTGDQVCAVCKQTITKGTTIAKKAHTLITVNQKAAGCTTTGYTGDSYCTTCKQTITKGSTVNALGHTSPDSKGNCTRCGTHIKDVEQTTQPSTPDQPQQQSGSCKYCGGTHTGPFGWLIQIFHNILAIFKR